MFPAPEAVHVPPPAPTHVHVAVSDAGNVSATVAPVAVLGPAFDAVIVYVVDPPGVAVVTPSVLVIDRSAFAASAWAVTPPRGTSMARAPTTAATTPVRLAPPL